MMFIIKNCWSYGNFWYANLKQVNLYIG